MTRVAVLLALAGCVDDALVDLPRSPEQCCLLWPSTADVSACFERFVEPGKCQYLACSAFDYQTSLVCRKDP